MTQESSRILFRKPRPSTGQFFLWLAVILAYPWGSASADVSTLALDSNQTHGSWTLTTGAMELPGELPDLSGTLAFSEPNFEKATLKIASDLRSLNLGGNLEALPIAALLQSLPPQNISFVSSKITRLSGDRYRIEGLLQYGKRQHTVVIPVTLSQLTKKNGKISVSYSGPIKEWNGQIPLPIEPGKSKISVAATLIFNKL